MMRQEGTYYDKNKERARDYYRQNREYFQAYQEEYRRNNQERIQGYREKRKTDKAALAIWKEQHRCSVLNRFKENKDRLAALKLAVGCVDCGRADDPVVLDFDHVHGTKTKAISTLVTKSWQVIERELEKCVVRCACCHRLRHIGINW